ncbi:PREDICTED: LOC18779427 [Prunus dulcis]|uniref:PREDICTED: LOC18779427 n=1 Tax=Prunus dulcis TaxID=3755 RepID=A0A5E4EHV6_PRUDU|nr:PREDICTED: LOC18779427 [Prunus dulcis]
MRTCHKTSSASTSAPTPSSTASLTTVTREKKENSVQIRIRVKFRIVKLHHRIQIRNAVDVNNLAVKSLKRDDLDLGQFRGAKACNDGEGERVG